MSLFVGEALVGDGNEIAHIDLMIGSKTGPVGVAFANATKPTRTKDLNSSVFIMLIFPRCHLFLKPTLSIHLIWQRRPCNLRLHKRLGIFCRVLSSPRLWSGIDSRHLHAAAL